ncbi:MAG: hypothetical protein RL235_988, partial [Chlamydiota bacterium]
MSSLALKEIALEITGDPLRSLRVDSERRLYTTPIGQ